MSKPPNGTLFVDREGSSTANNHSSHHKSAVSNKCDDEESSASGSHLSRGSFSEPSKAVDSVEFRSQEIGDWSKEALQGQNAHKRRSWKSGGFLLDSTRPSRGFHLFSRNQSTKDIDKGKKRAEPDDLTISKRRPQTQGHQRTISHGSSPLASHVSTPRDNNGPAEKNLDRVESEGRRSVITESSQSGTQTLGNDSGKSHQSPTLAFGFDTDPAQIVNMALSLNESRRRNLSGARLVSGSSNSRRVYSGNQVSPRDGDHRITSAAARSRGQTEIKPSRGFRGASAALEDEEIPAGEAKTKKEDVFYDVSDATFARVEKAKQYFELLYEYRRLLPHLPPLRASGQDVESSKALNRTSREYNPLQYVRNRRIRYREKRPLQSEEEGWHDLDNVRTWVNAVVEGHNQPRNDPDECVRLPQLRDRQKEPEPPTGADEPGTNSPASSHRRRNDNMPAKPRRPRQDLITHPADLIADAYWLEQGLNKTKIEDKDGNKLYPAHIGLKFDGWRNRTPLHQEELPKTSFDQERSRAPEAIIVPNLPEFRSSSQGRAKKVRRSGRHALQNPVATPQKNNSGSRHHGRKLLKHRRRSDSSSEPSSDSNSNEPRFRGRTKLSEHDSGPSVSGRSAFERKILDMLNADSERRNSSQSSKIGVRQDTSASASESRRGSRTSDKDPLEPEPRTSYEDNTTGPSSPTTNHFPSIAINLSPPGSRSPSPRKKPFQDRINPFSRDQNSSKRRVGVDSVDFAETSLQNGGSHTLSNEEKMPPPSDYASSRGTSPLSKRASLTPEEPIRPIELRRTQSTIGKSSGSARHDPSSRIRGIFKGGRIAELVGSEVSRVGDFIWKRDAPVDNNVPSGASSAASNVSDTEDEVLRTPPSRRLRRFQTDSSAKGLSPQQSRDERPQYHMTNLPSFTSPFKKDREEQERLEAPGSSPQDANGDPISRQLREMRSRSRSPRFERLAPPRLDVSPTPSSPERYRSGPDYQTSYRFGKAAGLAGTTRASENLNDALNIKPGLNHPPITGLASLNPSHSQSPSRGRSRLQTAYSTSSTREWSLSVQNPHTTTAEIARFRALLLSSGVKAREIHRRSQTVRNPPPAFLSSAFAPTPVPSVIRREEHLYASRALINALDSSSAAFRTDISQFSINIAPLLHARIQTLTDLVDNTLNPRVRAAGDEAGELSQKLTTSSTLAVKQLGDTVETVRRRRRRQLRWIRQVGYVIVEWMVVGILWWVWLIVMIWKIVRGTVVGVGRAIRWAFWL